MKHTYRVKLLAVAAAAAAAALLVLVMLTRDHGMRAGAAVEGRSRSQAARATSRSASEDLVAVADERLQADGRVPNGARERERISGARWIVAGRVLGWVGPQPEVLVAARAGDERQSRREVSSSAAQDGRFAFDVGGLLDEVAPASAGFPDELQPGAIELVVRAVAAEHVPAEARIDPATAAAIDTASGGVRLLHVDLELLRASGVRGRVLDAEGKPAALSSVHLVRVPDTSDRPLGSVAATAPDAGGWFRLITNLQGRFRLVAWDEQHRPAARPVALQLGRIEDVGDLRLEPGAALAGKVIARAGGYDPAGEILRASRVAQERELALGSALLQFGGERFEHARRTTVVAEVGAFRFAGAAPGLQRIEGIGAENACSLPGAAIAVDVLAPALELELALAEPRIRFAVEGPAGPLEQASIGLFEPDLGAVFECPTDADGRLELLTRERVEYEVDVRAEGHEPLHYPLVSPARGETMLQELSLRRSGAAGALELTLTEEGGAPVDRAALDFFAAGSRRSHPLFVREAYAPDGVLAVGGLPPGDYVVVVHPEGAFDRGASTLIEADLELEIASGETARASLTLRRGGRLELLVRDTNGSLLPATCRIEDARGSPVAVRFEFLDPTQNELYQSTLRPHPFPAGMGRAKTGGLARVQPALPPGNYQATLSLPGYRTERVSFRIGRGRNERVEVVLSREGES